MRGLISAAAVFFLLSISLTSGFSFDSSGVQNYVDGYNSKIAYAPDVLKGLLGNERINIDIIRGDGSIFSTGLEVENARVNRTVQGGLSDPTIIITTTESAINNIRGASDPVTVFQKESETGQVKIEGQNLVTRAKIGAVLSSSSVLGFFYNIFFGQRAS
jgi:hypothetical protein